MGQHRFQPGVAGLRNVAVGHDKIAERIKGAISFPQLPRSAGRTNIVQVFDDGPPFLPQKQKEYKRGDNGNRGLKESGEPWDCAKHDF
jgi:hypothetical protein